MENVDRLLKAQKRRRVFIFAWHQETKYAKKMGTDMEDGLLIHTGFFARTFPVEPSIHVRVVDLRPYEDTVEMTCKFHAAFENAGIMINGLVMTGRTTPKYESPVTLGQIREMRDGLDKYFLTDTQQEKFKYLKGSKKIPRKRPDGEIYYYSEGGMSYPDSLDVPGRTMLTSESTVNRSTHILEDKATGKIRFLTPVEAERLQSFPDNWMDTGMPEKRRYFMMGNALVTQLINRMEPRLSQIITGENKPSKKQDNDQRSGQSGMGLSFRRSGRRSFRLVPILLLVLVP